MPKLPAISTILSESYSSFKRFPGVLICAIVGAFSLSYYIDFAGDETYNWLIYLIFTCSLGAVLFLNAYLFFERNHFNIKNRIVYSVLIIAGLALYFYLQPEELNRISVVRFILFNLGLHLLVSFVAFIKYDEPNGFWHFNQILFIRLFISLLYSLVLFGGTALALATIDYLFEIDFDGDNYLRAFYFIFIIFNTWIFLVGIPKKIAALESDESYPKLLKFFSQFVLLPLVGVYIIILYGYVIRLFIIGQGPDTNVAYMVLALAIAGILAFLLVFPLGKQEKYKWLRIYRKVFYIILIPLIALFFVAIWHRVRDFGITENRYFIMVLALWLFGISLYFIFHTVQNIKVIPASLCVIAFLSSFGPWGAINFSRVSQLTRFETILTNNDLISNRKAMAADIELSNEEASQLYSVTKYLVDVFGLNVLQPYFDENLDSLASVQGLSEYSKYTVVLDQLNIQQPIVQPKLGKEQYFYFNAERNYVINIEGYRQLHKFYLNLNSDEVSISEYRSDSIYVHFIKDDYRLQVEYNDEPDATIHLNTFILQFINKHGINHTAIPYSELAKSQEGKNFDYKLVLQNVGGKVMGDSLLNIDHIDAWLLIGQKQ